MLEVTLGPPVTQARGGGSLGWVWGQAALLAGPRDADG